MLLVKFIYPLLGGQKKIENLIISCMVMKQELLRAEFIVRFNFNIVCYIFVFAYLIYHSVSRINSPF